MKRAAVSILVLAEMIAGGVLACFHVATAQSLQKGGDQNPRADYVGDSACRSCHADKIKSYHDTGHFLTSRLADATSILGSFASGANTLKTSNPNMFFQMEEKQIDDKSMGTKQTAFFQTAIDSAMLDNPDRSERFAFVIGSGGKGQTYLWWKANALFELPVSYWRGLGWVNSPGYRDGVINFDRPIIPRCLECHASYFQLIGSSLNQYRAEDFALGIDCEKCHAAGRAHAQQEQSPAAASSSTGILNPARFSRERQLDLCAWCHARGQPLLPSFSYVPGEPLARWLDLPHPGADEPMDVHGNQLEMLKRSRCFSASTMTCNTCHDVHRVQHDLSEFSGRCLSCHKPGSATFSKASHPVSNNCIDCHMPEQETSRIIFNSKGAKIRARVRSHWIKIYSGTPAPTGI